MRVLLPLPLGYALVFGTRPALAVVILPTEAAGVLLADFALDSTLLPALLAEVDDTLTVRLWTAHIVVLVFGDDTVSEELAILGLHFFTADL